MKNNITVLTPKITHRKCPVCGYIISQLELELLRKNLPCSKCGKTTMNDFIPAENLT